MARPQVAGGETASSMGGSCEYILNKQWVFENRVLRRIFGPQKDEVTGE
jgi:putative flippase GtrA